MKAIVDFEVNDNNFWVAVNDMIAKKINTGVIVYTEEIEAPFTSDQEVEYRKLVSPNMGGTNLSAGVKDFNAAIAICYNAATREMIQQAMNELNGGNGVMLVARNLEHADELYQYLIATGLPASEIFQIKRGNSIFLTSENVNAGLIHPYRVVIAPINYSTGYSLSYYHTMISSIYPSNQATREQIEGRINRIGQKSKQVTYKYVHVGILTYIMRHHKDAKNLADVLRTLATDITFN